MFVAKHLMIHRLLENIKEYTQETNHFNVLFVARDLLNHQSLKYIKEYTQETIQCRLQTCDVCGKEFSLSCHMILKDITEYIEGQITHDNVSEYL